MKKFTILSIAAVAAVSTFISCNSSSSTDDYMYDVVSNTGVSAFKLSANDSVLANLDTIFFSIDLEKAEIFNADSLPYGTPINKLVPVITMMDTPSKLELKVPMDNGRDSIHNYLENPGDTIDFSRGPVTMSVTSLDGLVSRDYIISVLVHKEESDSLVWSQTARTILPSALSAPTRQHTAKAGSSIYCLTNAGTSWSIATRGDVSDSWDKYMVTVPEGSDINSFCGTDNGVLYILAPQKLYASTDGGRSWSDTGKSLNYIYGNYGENVLGAVENDGEWTSVEYPSGKTAIIPDGMPVAGTSPLLSYSFALGESPISTFVGGRDSQDRMDGSSWAYDGSEWARISIQPIPKKLEDMILVPYFAYNVSSAYIATKYSIFMAFGGADDSGNNRTVYVSSDYGRTWNEGGELIQLPPYMPSLSQAQGFVENITLSSRSTSGWELFEPSYRIPANAELFGGFGMSRATRPVDTWECPYIYIYGGVTDEHGLSPYVWRGVLNRLAFKPII